jgi:hypothetical protein
MATSDWSVGNSATIFDGENITEEVISLASEVTVLLTLTLFQTPTLTQTLT